jgi:anti-sigma regulatory factor (Ser/Thr protein kinase)
VVDLPGGAALAAGAPRTSTKLSFDPADLLLLFTDGLLEGAGRTVEAGMTKVREQVAARPELDPRRLCALLLDHSAGGSDDIALLAVGRVDGERRTSVHALPAESTAPGLARRWSRATLGGWGLSDDQIEVAVLCLNELVTNALLHARSSSRLELDLDDARLLVLVSDDGQATSLSAQLSQTDAVRGRGLALVEQLSDAWGTERDSKGMTVWFELARE